MLFAPFGLQLASGATLQSRGLNPGCAPGGNFNLSPFTLELPTGTKYKPQQIQPGSLTGCSGYQDPGHHYFFTESGDGALVMKVPGSPAKTGCITYKESKHCRTELRENRSWDPNANTNRLAVTLAVVQPDSSGHGTVIGQIHINNGISLKPVAELYFNKNGDIAIGVEKTRAGNSLQFTTLGNVKVGQKFSYEIRYEKNVLAVLINGGPPHAVSTYSLNAPLSYFKVGNYNQGEDPSDLHFFNINLYH